MTGDSLLFQLFQQCSPLQLLQLYAVNSRFRTLIQHLFRQQAVLRVTHHPSVPLSLHEGWQYLAPHSLQRVPLLSESSRSVLYLKSADSVRVLYPYSTTVYRQRASFRGSLRSKRVLYQSGSLVAAHFPGSKSGHAAQQQIKVTRSLHLEPQGPGQNAQLILWSEQQRQLHLLSSSSSLLYQACIPPGPNPEDWITALCSHFVKQCGISGPCLFLCEQQPVACRLLLTSGPPLALKTTVYCMAPGYPCPLSSSSSMRRPQRCHTRITLTSHSPPPLTV